MQILLNNVITIFSKNIFPKNVQILFVLQDEKTPRITFCFGQSRSQQKFIMNMKSYSTNVQKWISSSKSRMNYFPFFSLSGDLTTNLYQKDDQDFVIFGDTFIFDGLVVTSVNPAENLNCFFFLDEAFPLPGTVICHDMY